MVIPASNNKGLSQKNVILNVSEESESARLSVRSHMIGVNLSG